MKLDMVYVSYVILYIFSLAYQYIVDNVDNKNDEECVMKYGKNFFFHLRQNIIFLQTGKQLWFLNSFYFRVQAKS